MCRRLTNFSTGRLGPELANFLAAQRHEVTLLLGEQATHHGELNRENPEFHHHGEPAGAVCNLWPAICLDAIFHAAAVSDFGFGKIFAKSADGKLVEIKSRKIPTRVGGLMAELMPTPKIIAELRDWFPEGAYRRLEIRDGGWPRGGNPSAQRQIAECRTDACVANGPAYGKVLGW